MKNGVSALGIPWMELKCIMLSEIDQAQKNKANLTEGESRIVRIAANTMASRVTI